MSKGNKDLRLRLIKILDRADQHSELYNQTVDKIFDEIEREMLLLQEAFRDNPNIMYDDNTDDFLTVYIRRKYHNKIEINESKTHKAANGDNKQPEER